jgi:hypothetical protein
MDIYNKVPLIYYTILVGLTEIQFVVIILFIGISPLICFIVLFYWCFCRKSIGKYIDLPVKKATTQDINNVGGDCSICFQSINLEEKIYVLNCSNKHIFHCSCLSHWTKVRNNCPICRF